jgi:hypothetical protein
LLQRLLLRDRCILVRFDGDFDVSTGFKRYLFAFFVSQSIFDANLTVKVLGSFDRNLGLLGPHNIRRNDLFYRSGQVTAGFSGSDFGIEISLGLENSPAEIRTTRFGRQAEAEQ